MKIKNIIRILLFIYCSVMLTATPVTAEDTSLADEKKRFEKTAHTVFTIGKDMPVSAFNFIAEALEIALQNEEHAIRGIFLDSKKNSKYRSFVVRRFKGQKTSDVILYEGDEDEVYIYLTSEDGFLRMAISKEKDSPKQILTEKEANSLFLKEVGFWQRLEVKYKRKWAQEGNTQAD